MRKGNCFYSLPDAGELDTLAVADRDMRRRRSSSGRGRVRAWSCTKRPKERPTRFGQPIEAKVLIDRR